MDNFAIHIQYKNRFFTLLCLIISFLVNLSSSYSVHVFYNLFLDWNIISLSFSLYAHHVSREHWALLVSSPCLHIKWNMISPQKIFHDVRKAENLSPLFILFVLNFLRVTILYPQTTKQTTETLPSSSLFSVKWNISN